MATRAVVLNEVSKKLKDGEVLCLQEVLYIHTAEDKNSSASLPCFRFIRRDELGRMKAQRGQAAIPNLKMIGVMTMEMNKLKKGL